MGKIENMAISWSISRGQDTYGYNICRLDCNGARWKTMGGGYDMVGTVVGMCFSDMHQDELQALVNSRKKELVDCGYQVKGYKKIPDLYGLTINPRGEISLDGACGINSMENIMRACGFEVEYTVNRRGHVTNYLIQRV